MKKLFILLVLFANTNLYSGIKFEKIYENLDKPWSMSFVDNDNILITEKKGRLLFLNLKNKYINDIQHNLSLVSSGQGGLLDVLYKDNQVYISYSENRGNRETSTSVSKGSFNKKT